MTSINNGEIKNIQEIEMINAPSRAKRKVEIDDILIGAVRPNLKNHAFVNDFIWSQNLIVSTGFCVLRPKKDKVVPKFNFYNVMTDNITNILTENATGTSYPAINAEIIKSIKIPIP